MEIEIIIKDLIKVSSNQIYAGQHWTKRKKLKDDYLWLTTPFKSLPKISEKVDLDFKFFFGSKPLDSSNCGFLVKILEDCLVHYGVLQGDTIKFVGKVSMESFKSRQKDTNYCVININLK
jgi:hypothetical protein